MRIRIWILNLHWKKMDPNKEIFDNVSFIKSLDLGLESKTGFLQYLVDILPLGSGSFNSHIFVEMLRI